MNSQGTKIGAAYVEITARDEKFRERMRQVQEVGRRSSSDLATSLRKVDDESRRVTRGINAMGVALVALGGGLVTGKLTKLADTFSLMRSRIRLVTQAGEDMLKIEEQLAQQALANRADLQSTIDLYTRLRQSRKDLTDQQAQMLVDRWSKALIISASSAQEAASSTMQFSQAMAAGVLQGQELRSVIQGNSAFAVYLAQGLGVATGELRKMGEEGKITIDAIMKALEVSGGAIESDFQKKALTVGQALTNVETATVRLVGTMDQAFGISSGMATWVNNLANALGDLTTAMQPPMRQAEIAADKLNTTNRAIASDTAHLKDLHDKLTEAIKSGGEAAAYAARLELDALNLRITKNKELSQVYEAQARAKLAEAEAELKRRTDGRRDGFEVSELQMKLAEVQLAAAGKTAFQLFGYSAYRADAQSRIDARLGTPMERLDKAMAEIARLQDLGQPLSKAQNELLKFAGEIADARLAVEANRKQIDALKDGGTLAAPSMTTGAAAPSGDEIARLAGYYTALETYERSLAQIRKASAEGAEGANRAIIQAMMDYLDAGGSVRRVLEDIGKLSGGMLDPESVKLIERFVDAMHVMDTIDVDDTFKLDHQGNRDKGHLDRVSTDPGPWAYYEQRVAEATKWGLMNAVETGDWGDAFGQILSDVTREALSNALDVLWQALAQIDWGGQGQGWAGFFNMVGGSFSGKASGGAVSAGDLYRVGEKGSEWFVPNVDGFILPNDFKRRSLDAPMSVNVPTQLIVNGNADSVTRREIAETLDRFSRGLPTIIDARVRDRRKRGAY